MGTVPLIAMAVGLLISPESLTLLGNSVGIAGASFLIFILTGLVVHLFTALSFGERFSTFPGPGGEALLMEKTLGSIVAIVLPFCSRVLFTLCASTAILVTSGYVFNEVFLYWFPNFGFSFSLLGLLLIINLLGARVSKAAQICFVTTAVLGLLALSVIGLFESGSPHTVFQAIDLHSFHTIRVVFLGLVLFVGFDLAGFAEGNSGNHPIRLMRSMVLGIILVGIIFALWGLASTTNVSAERLANTTIPHMVAAREILGQSGRVIMGLVVISGSCAAINALLLAVSRMISGMARQGSLPSFLALALKRTPIPLILLAIGIGAMMASGMAGEPTLEVYTRAGISFWLLNYAAIHLAVLIMSRRYSNRFRPFQTSLSPVIPFVGMLAWVIGLIGLLWTDPQAIPVLKFMVVLLVILSILTFLSLAVTRRRKRSSSRGNAV